MDKQLTQTISLEVNELIYDHMRELHGYLNFPILQDIQTPEPIISLFGKLAEICNETADNVSTDRYLEAQRCLSEIRTFLGVFNQQIDSTFEGTKVGQLLVAGTQWCDQVEKSHPYSMDDVWDIIAPAIPDHIVQLSYNTFEAQWWSPIPMMDIEILQRTEGITILTAPMEPKHLPGGLSVQFTLSLVVGGED